MKNINLVIKLCNYLSKNLDKSKGYSVIGCNSFKFF